MKIKNAWSGAMAIAVLLAVPAVTLAMFFPLPWQTQGGSVPVVSGQAKCPGRQHGKPRPAVRGDATERLAVHQPGSR